MSDPLILQGVRINQKPWWEFATEERTGRTDEQLLEQLPTMYRNDVVSGLWQMLEGLWC